MSRPLSPDEIARFQALVKPAAVLLLMLRLDRPSGPRELADLLGLDEHTVAKYLRILANLNLVARSGYQGGYILLGGGQLILGDPETVKKNQPTTTVDSSSSDNKNIEEVEYVAITSRPAQHHASHAPPTPLYEALRQTGIGEPKRSQLCELTNLTPESVRTWEAQLKHDKGRRYSAGLLIHVLESGDPAPPANANGHFLGCDCAACQRLKYLICPYCNQHPCTCPA